MLKAEFLNKGAVTNDLIKKLLEIKPKYEINYLETKIYINEVRCIISDLKIYDVDLIADASAHTLVISCLTNYLLRFDRNLSVKYLTITPLFLTFSNTTST